MDLCRPGRWQSRQLALVECPLSTPLLRLRPLVIPSLDQVSLSPKLYCTLSVQCALDSYVVAFRLKNYASSQ